MSAAGQVLVPPPNPFSKAEQNRMLAESRERVRQYGFLMKRSVDASDTKEALKNAAILIAELRTGLLTPKVYYELYIDVFSHLQFLEMYFASLQRSGTPVSEIYEHVQHSGNVLVRLYMMIAAGSVYIKSGQAAAKDVLCDLLEMARGVQHPLRGLFLRYYLVSTMKDKLPDIGSAYEGTGGTLGDAIDFCVVNFGEMNRLWVRMQHSSGGTGKNKKRRERERQDLRILVGGNFDRLSALTGLDARLYVEDVLPRLLAEVTACRDRIAQPYLMECIVQAFPVEYTHAALPKLLEAVKALVPEPAVAKAVLLALINRIKDEALAASKAADEGEEGSAAAATAAAAAKAAAAASSSSSSSAGDNRIPGLPVEGNVFEALLTAVSALASTRGAAFRTTATTAAAGGSAAGGGGGADDGASSSASGSTGGPVAAECIAAALDVFACLMSFTLACHPKHLAHVDAVLHAAAGYIVDVLGATGSGTGKDVDAAARDAAAATAAVRASTRSALSRLTGGGSGPAGEGAEEAATPTSKAAAGGSGTGTGAAAVVLARALTDDCSRAVVALLSLVQDDLGLSVLSLDHYSTLMGVLSLHYKRQVARALLAAVLAAGVRVKSPEITRRLCANLGPLLKDDGEEATTPADGLATGPDAGTAAASGGSGASSSSSSSSSGHAASGDVVFLSEQRSVAKLVLLLGGTSDASVAAAIAAKASGASDAAAVASATPDGPDADTDAHFVVLQAAREHLSHGGATRTGITYPPLITAALQLSRRIREKDAAGFPRGRATVKRLFQFVHETCISLATTHAELALRMFLQCAHAAGTSGFASEFFSQAFIIFDDITDSRVQQRCLTQIVSSLQSCIGLDLESYETLCARSTQMFRKLLRKPDQVRHLLLCARLFWRGPLDAPDGAERYERPGEVLEILQRTLKIADSCMPAQPALFVDILEAYVYFFEKRCATVEPVHLSDLLALCREQAEAMKPSSEREEVAGHYRNVVAHIAAAKAGSPVDLAALYEGVRLASD